MTLAESPFKVIVGPREHEEAFQPKDTPFLDPSPSFMLSWPETSQKYFLCPAFLVSVPGNQHKKINLVLWMTLPSFRHVYLRFASLGPGLLCPL
jgi:hypothetical protein